MEDEDTIDVFQQQTGGSWQSGCLCPLRLTGALLFMEAVLGNPIPCGATLMQRKTTTITNLFQT
ncbi:hypothetical protein GH733_016847 [Mirounga leonina]|nr:hypothetical protein GH733_016847 [Mirounga leonina]